YPAALDDCVAVNRWALADGGRFGAAPGAVAVAGESAGGNLATAVALRLRDGGAAPLAAQVLVYPVVAAHTDVFESRRRFDGIILSERMSAQFWAAYGGGRDIDRESCAAPLHAPDLAGL